VPNSTSHDGSTVEPALIYDGGERRTHVEHAAEAYDCAHRADDYEAITDRPSGRTPGDLLVIERLDARAQWHATMAVYEAIASQAQR
jgi:hypothetical protein